MRPKTLYFTAVLLLLMLGRAMGQSGGKPETRNDHIFPAAESARPFITYDARGFLIHGKRTFVVSAGLEYARIPRGLWADRLLRLKRAGFNTVEVYTFWNYHEPLEGAFNFSGDRDLGAFLRLVKNLGLYAIVRVGPYYCGEWNFGGYPIWLKFKPGLKAREDNPQFLAAVDRFFERLMPIVAANQVHKGGPVILVQLENEHPDSWGNLVPNGYFRHLKDKSVSLGLEVPYFFSGLHPGNDPAGNAPNLDDPKRPNPWFSTEYWGVWFFNYGAQPQDSTLYDRRTWKIIAHGGNGYNVYMAHGGSNFDYNNDRDMAASYDYGAAVGQTGDLRPIYYGFKRAAWFARSFQEILANSTDAGNRYRSTVRDTAIKVNARSGPAGSIAFLDNPGKVARRVTIYPPADVKGAAPVSQRLASGEIFPVVHHYPLFPGLALSWSPTRIYSIVPQGETLTLIVYGAAGSAARLAFKAAGAVRIGRGKANFHTISPGTLRFSATFAAAQPTEYFFETGGKRIRILALPHILAQRTWLNDVAGQPTIVVGPSYLGTVSGSGAATVLETERYWREKRNFPVWLFGPDPGATRLNPKPESHQRLSALKLASWEMHGASSPAGKAFDDTNWMLSAEPLQMGADGDTTAHAWYRTQLKVAETGTYVIRFASIRERVALFLDGTRIDTGEIGQKEFPLRLEGGIAHTLAGFASHTGRNKLLFYRGALDTMDRKGISGQVMLRPPDTTKPPIPVTGWKLKGGSQLPLPQAAWEPLQKANGGGPAFFRTTFQLPETPGTRIIWRVITTSLGHGSVWVNGHNLGRYPEKIRINGLYIPETWLKTGENTIMVFDEDGTSPAGVRIEAEAMPSRDVVVYR